jgi:hypothetical protein
METYMRNASKSVDIGMHRAQGPIKFGLPNEVVPTDP